MWQGADGMGWWMVFDGVLWIVLLGSLFALAIRVLGRGGQREADESVNALEIAERRYARGEIGADELVEIRRNLAPARRREAS